MTEVKNSFAADRSGLKNSSIFSLPARMRSIWFSGRYTIDAKSLLGIYSLDLSNPLTLVIYSDDCDGPAPAAPRAPPRLPRSVNPLPSLSFPYTARLVLSPSSEPGGFLLRKRSARATIEAENRSRRAKGAAYVEIIQRKKSGADRSRRGASIAVYFYQQSGFSCSTHFMKVRCATPS